MAKLDLDQFSRESQSSESLHFENMDDEIGGVNEANERGHNGVGSSESKANNTVAIDLKSQPLQPLIPNVNINIPSSASKDLLANSGFRRSFAAPSNSNTMGLFNELIIPH